MAAGYDFPWMLQNVVPFGLWGGAARHDAHHQNGTVYYQKFFTYIDDLLGTVLPEPPAVPRGAAVPELHGATAAPAAM